MRFSAQGVGLRKEVARPRKDLAGPFTCNPPTEQLDQAWAPFSAKLKVICKVIKPDNVTTSLL